jgi:hypothetical protein
MAYRRSRIVTSVPSGSGGTWMMERSRFIEHTEEEVSEFMDQTESLFRNPDPFVTTIPETSESSGTLENIRTDHLPCLRKVREHLRSELRKHEYFRYLLRGMPSCKHKSEDALVLALRVETGIERDQNYQWIRVFGVFCLFEMMKELRKKKKRKMICQPIPQPRLTVTIAHNLSLILWWSLQVLKQVKRIRIPFWRTCV